MLKRGYKLIISVVLVATLFIGFCSAFASAEPAWLIRAKAGIAAAMLASQLVINPVNYALDDALAEGIDPLGYVQSIGQNPWESYLEQSVIKVVPDTVYIDGVPYSDIWLGPEAAESLRLAGLDFTSAYNILNNQSEAITYATGAGYCEGEPLYGINNEVYSVSYNVPLATGVYYAGSSSLNANCVDSSARYPRIQFRHGDTVYNYADTFTYNWPYLIRLKKLNDTSVALQNKPYTGNWSTTAATGEFINSPFSFDYTSGVIDAPVDPDDGLLVRVPTSYTDPDPQVTTYNYDIHDLVNIYPQVTQDHGHQIEIDPDLNPDFQTDIDLGNSVGDLIRTILNVLDLLDNVNIDFAPEPDSPQPGPVDPDPAVPDVPVSDQDGTWLDELLRWIKHAIDVLHQDLEDVLNSIDTQFTEIYHELEQIFDAIKDWAQQLPDVIKRAHAKGMKDALSALKKIILPLLAPIKALMNLWHYVVEWFTSINAPFLWIFGIMSSISYNLVLPVYASLAGVICIAIYKSFGR